MPAIMLLLALLSGCASVGPDYSRPSMLVPEAFQASIANAGSGPDLDRWWLGFNDPVLTGLIANARAGNLDIKTAVARLRESRARYSISRSDEYPSVNLSASARSARTGEAPSRQSYATSIDASWELDLFGANRRDSEAAAAELLATREGLHSALASLSAEVALEYASLRASQRRIGLMDWHIGMLLRERDLIHMKADSGLLPKLDLMQADENLASVEADMPSLKLSLNKSLNRIEVLLGRYPGALRSDEALLARAEMPKAPFIANIGAPADLIRRRPDIRKAELNLIAAYARIGVAEADLYPKLTLSGSIGYEAGSAGALFDPASFIRSLGSSLLWPIFKGRAIEGNIEASRALRDQALYSYEKAVLTAVEEVETAAASLRAAREEAMAINEAQAASAKALEATRFKYEGGLTDYESLLNAESRQLTLMQRQVSAELNEITQSIALYKALGGGWDERNTDDAR